MAKLNETQIGVLRLLADGKSAYTFCNGQAEHGARTCTVLALRRRGYVSGFEITADGRSALESTLAQAGESRLAGRGRAG